MKLKIISMLCIALLGVTTIQAQATVDRFEVQVDGLGCPFCAYGLEKKFKELKGIKKVKIEIDSGIFSFTYPAEKALSLSDVAKQVKKAGYTPVTLQITRFDGEIETLDMNQNKGNN